MRKAAWRANFTQFRLDTIYEMVPGDYHVASTLPQGDIPLVACGDRDNGIIRFVDVPAKHAYSCKLTVAFNGSPLTTNYHPYKFATKDDVAVCHSRRPLRLSTELFIQTMMNRERWRYSYYRKCYLDKLKRLGILLPAKDGELDEDAMQAAMESAPYWNFLQARLAATVAF
jgi:hypothetical protein